MKRWRGVVVVLTFMGLAIACGHVPTNAPAATDLVPGIPDSVFARYHMTVSQPALSNPPPISHDQAVAIVGGNSISDVQSATLARVTGTVSYIPSGIFWIVV